MILFPAHPVDCHIVAGNAAFTVSTAALSFTSMERMLQSMAAVKTTAKMEDLFMAVSFQALGLFLKSCFVNWMPECTEFLAEKGSLPDYFGKREKRRGICLKKKKSRLFY